MKSEFLHFSMDAKPAQGRRHLSRLSSKHYYEKESWDIRSWIDVISIEYETLIDYYPFNDTLGKFSKHSLRLLDVGCGTAIFPSYLDKVLSDEIHLNCDLLDISSASLGQASRVIDSLEHFTTRQLHEGLIENIPKLFHSINDVYDVIWAIHSLTTVDLSKMNAVYNHLFNLLMPGGYLFIYQLAAKSTYQRLHSLYRSRHANAVNEPRFMQYEDSKEILDSLNVQYMMHELSFSHGIALDKEDLLEMYLRKSILDDSVDVLKFFSDILPKYVDEDSKTYKFPQFVNFIVVSK